MEDLFSVVATTCLPTVVGRDTVQCFASPRYVYRDWRLVKLLSEHQPTRGGCIIATLAPRRPTLFTEWAASILGVLAYTPSSVLGRHLRARKHVLTLPQIERVVEVSENESGTGLRPTGGGNFAFVENKDESVSLVDVKYSTGWNAFSLQFGDDLRWSTGCLLLLRVGGVDIPRIGS